MCEALTVGLDRVIGGLVSSLPERVAIVAVGGYGRRELSPYSDVDLMILHSIDNPADVAAAIFRPLWDAKLRLGHAVRTLKEATSAARERFDTHTTLLTSRLVAGDEELFARLMEQVAAVTRARPLRRYLADEERRRRADSPYLLMATDVKEGRGGLRTIHGFEWEKRREELIGRFSSELGEEEDGARETLLQIRNGLHAVTGRAHDVFSTELREPVARWLGSETFEIAHRMVAAMQTVDAVASRRWPEVVEEKPKRLWARLIGKPLPVSASSEPTVDEMIWILETGEWGRITFERLWDSGLLDGVLPEWENVRSLPQVSPFHEHPVASHLWRTTDEMRALIADDGHYGRVAGEIDDRGVLLLAAFLHDVGKGHGGDHAEIGADVARALGERLGVDRARARLIADAVRHHLLLSSTATRRDLDDSAVIDEIARTVASLRLLQVLYLLTVADSKATGATMWSEWKATLLRTLFVRCAARFGADRAPEGGTTRDDVLASADPGRIAMLETHLNRMPEEYLRSSTTEEVLWHLQLILEMDGPVNVGVRQVGPVESAVVVGSDRPGFRRHVAESFAANGIDVLEARMLSRRDGVIVDTYKVRDDRTELVVSSEKWRSLRADLEAGLLGRLDTGSKVAARAAAYERRPGDEPVASGAVDPASGDLVLTIKCSDRVGRLAEILTVLNDCDLDIRLAKIDSREGEAVDTFHVGGYAGPADPDGLRALEHRIASAIRV